MSWMFDVGKETYTTLHQVCSGKSFKELRPCICSCRDGVLFLLEVKCQLLFFGCPLLLGFGDEQGAQALWA